jgi:hypothetical protein
VNDIPVGTLRAVLLHHVAPGERFSGDVLAATRIRTLNRDFLTPSVAGGAAFIDGARIVIADVDASNGVIHVIDHVLVPGTVIQGRNPWGGRGTRTGRARSGPGRFALRQAAQRTT